MSDIEIPTVDVPSVEIPVVEGVQPQAPAAPQTQPQVAAPQPVQPQAQQPQTVIPQPTQPTQPTQPQSTPYQATSGGLQPIGVLSWPSTSLMEVTTFKELGKQYPRYFSIIMFVPGQQDPSKQSGRTYVMDQRSNIKFDLKELFELSYALEEAAATGQTQYVKFADTSKFSGGQQAIKKVSINVSNSTNGLKIFINYDGDGKKVSIPLSKYDAIGLSKQLYVLAEQAQIKWNEEKAAQRGGS